MKPALPLYQHPTCVILVDDSASFVASLAFQMPAGQKVKSFSCSVEALRWIFSTFRRTLDADVLCNLVDRPPQDEMHADDDSDGDADHHQALRKMREPQRFSAPAVVVIDYAMPHIDGLDFCQALEGLPCKKILFTGEADELIAVDAFNRGLIDHYIKKSDALALERLEQAIATLERDYFFQRSVELQSYYTSQRYDFLYDECLGQLVQDMIRRYGFVEHYVFPEPSGILFLDAEGSATLMVIENQAGLQSHLEAAEEYGAPMALQEALRKHSVVPFFWPSGGMYNGRLLDWQQYCMPAILCEGKKKYYWAFFSLPAHFLAGEIYSYKHFLREKDEKATPYPYSRYGPCCR